MVLRSFRTSSCLCDSPTVLSTLQPDLKAALRSKDKPRLTVLRSLLAEITNASKTPKPIDTDSHFYNLLQKQIKSSNAAVDEFAAASREDLVDKERSQLKVLEEYAARIPTVAEDEVEAVVREVVQQLGDKAKVGSVMGRALGKMGGRPVDAEMVKRKVEEIVGAHSS